MIDDDSEFGTCWRCGIELPTSWLTYYVPGGWYCKWCEYNVNEHGADLSLHDLPNPEYQREAVA